VAALAVVLFLTIGVGLAVICLPRTPGTAPTAAVSAPPRPGPPPVELTTPDPGSAEPLPDWTPPAAPAPQPAQPRSPTPAAEPPGSPAALSESLARRVNRAIDDGLAFLRRRRGKEPTGMLNGDPGLLGLTLLECGVPRHDPDVQRLAGKLRGVARRLGGTYQLSLAIFFFNRLNGPGDAELVRALALQLVAGQTAAGDWGYSCPALDAEEERRLAEFLRTVARTNPVYQGLLHSAAAGLPAKLQGIGLARPGVTPPRRVAIHTDNSNTQFAVLALWVARRRGAPVQPALSLAARHFRDTQNADGSWPYTTDGGRSRPANTCAGLLGLAVEHGIRTDSNPPRDEAVVDGLHYLGDAVNRAEPPRPRHGLGYGAVGTMADLYFFWSLERTAMIYGLDVVGDREWYPWAAERIVDAQQADGSWRSAYGPWIDTCFALLVLRRTNLAPDLTATLRQRPPQGTSARPPAGPSGSVTARPGPSGLGPASPAPAGPALGPARDPDRKPGSN
jgi:hypothetical protein